MSSAGPPKFTLRFRNRSNHEILGLLAERYGVTKNQLAEELLERELQAAALLLEQDLSGTLALLKNYRRDEHLGQAIADFAQAEGEYAEPIDARMVAMPRIQDAHGIADAFG
jgi:hypothetical protein